jgi:hypothetical protein
MTDLAQLKRDCADALEALTRDQRTDRIAGLVNRSGSSAPRTNPMAS